MLRIFLISIATFFALVTLSHPQPASVLAHPCPGGPGANEVQVGMSGGGNGVAPVPMCAARQGGAAGPAPAPTYYHIYGLIAWQRGIRRQRLGNKLFSNEHPQNERKLNFANGAFVSTI